MRAAQRMEGKCQKASLESRGGEEKPRDKSQKISRVTAK